jgi:PST family polysaccharide transporter
MSSLLFITFSLVPAHTLFPEWLFQGLERMKHIALLNLLSKTVFTIAIFVFIKEKSDFILQPLFVSLGTFCSGIITMIIVVKWKIRFYIPPLSEIKTTLKDSSDIFINSIVPNLYNNFSVLLLGFFGGPVANGKLDAGNKFVSVGQHLQIVISRTFFPFLSRRIDKHSVFARYSIGLSAVVAFVLFVFSPSIIHSFFTDEFHDAIMVIRILSISIIFLTVCDVYVTNFLIIEGHEKI